MTQESGKFQHDDIATHIGNIQNLYEDVMSYYIQNIESLDKYSVNDYNRLNNVQSAGDLYAWAYDTKRDMEFISYEQFTREPQIIDSKIPKDIIAKSLLLAEKIQTTSEQALKTLFDRSYGLADSLRLQYDTRGKLVDIFNKVHEGGKENTTALLFRSSNGYVAIGMDACQLAKLNPEWHTPSMTYTLPDKEQWMKDTKVLFINNDGYELVAEQPIDLRITKAPVNIDNIQKNDYLLENIKILDEARQTIAYFAGINPENSVVLNTRGQITQEQDTWKASVDSIIIANGKLTAVISGLNEGEQIIRTVDNEGIMRMPFQFKHFADFLNNNRTEILGILNGNEKQLLDNYAKAVENYSQNIRLKAEHPDSIILQKMGNTYMAFGADAKRVAAELGTRLYDREVQGNDRVLFTTVNASQYLQLAESPNNIHVAKAAQQEQPMLWRLAQNTDPFGSGQKRNPELNLSAVSVKPTRGGNWVVYAKVGEKTYTSDIKPADAKAYRDTPATERDKKAREIATNYLMRKIIGNQITPKQHSLRR